MKVFVGTKRLFGRVKRFRALTLYSLVALTISAILMAEAGLSRLPFAEPELDTLSEIEKKQLDVFTEMNKLLTTLATLTIAAATVFMINREGHTELRSGALRRAFVSWTFIGASLYFGHLSYQRVLWMLHEHFLDLFSAQVWWPSRAQFWSFLIGVIVLLDFIWESTSRAHSDLE